MQRRGERISCPAAPHSSTACATVSPVLATHPKTRSRQSLVCHTYDTLRRLCTSFFPARDDFNSRIAGQRHAVLFAFGHQSPFTSYQSPPFVLLRALSRGATIGPERRKYWETKPLLSVSK